MKKAYDFILFENFHHAHNHKIDVVIIARMLQSRGLKVAILNVYGEDDKAEIEGVPVLHIPLPAHIPNDKWYVAPRNKVHSLFCTLRFLYQQHFYFKHIVKAVTPLADRFYCGSYHALMTSSLMEFTKPCYFWGLRSWTMTGFRIKFRSKPIEALKMLRMNRLFKSNENCRLFVSNELIKREFNALGIPDSRMAIREERCVENFEVNAQDFEFQKDTFLVIGKLRKEKNIPFTVESFERAAVPGSRLLIVGSSDVRYEETIASAIKGLDNVERNNTFLSYDDFIKCFRKSEFVLFADEQGNSSITNGTMMEALINHTPVICPDYLPFSYYVDNYHIGLSYSPMDTTSFAAAIKKASEVGSPAFRPAIDVFLNTISFEKASEKLFNGIYN